MGIFTKLKKEFGFYWFIKQKQLLHLMNSASRLPISRMYEDDQVVSNNCCNPFMRVSTSNSTDKLPNSQKSIRLSKERGIQLTRKPKSYTKLLPANQLFSRRTQPLRLNQRQGRRQQDEPSDSNAFIGQQNQKKSMLVQKCLDYKNKKIQEHRNQSAEQISLNLSLSKRQELCSTMRNTARTINSSSFGALLIDRPSNSSNNISLQHSYLQHCREQEKQNAQPQETSYVCYVRSPKKTLEKVFEETKGRRIVTLQSQLSHEQGSYQYSQAESYDFPYLHN